jgi:hypothetical protein
MNFTDTKMVYMRLHVMPTDRFHPHWCYYEAELTYLGGEDISALIDICLPKQAEAAVIQIAHLVLWDPSSNIIQLCISRRCPVLDLDRRVSIMPKVMGKAFRKGFYALGTELAIVPVLMLRCCGQVRDRSSPVLRPIMAQLMRNRCG